ncbi:TPA: plasmid partitioning protein RepB C-terminal domain-containing protein [Pseudomonas aeruginosa]|uniref:plasmid partitioning protein RepB C-terminal domain-containing protein n=1 Tax=Pseudomonas aeruginosa TaxID=287 RepID=UPI0006655DF8|nr:plasmid partitioning protein RepB C-terminal domain-containing protein [Pseudomonas aeruginosa]MBI7315536.1 ParB/RepB/Spo0J family partition protein [Pseudomonas aeruginosa]MBI7327840.1 ParB/RepB/Spo0J family partition protein [Pseudomonas aeruginosa]MBI7496115.1 ParB/RepB/Spo0J family partition protein [Pseudomonas aeruginosa]NYU28492.1 ParB/RepB/Spo0J family partition protein [Pseudomonas aeruginosa]RPM99096.1 chromosome partitioning protein ParB [Pseudomonas aeruginosa]
MSRQHQTADLQMIPVDQIAVLNPRDRNGRVFEEIVGNIKNIGLKKPVTVTPRDGLEDGKRYLLICGEGRLKAFKSLGEKEIPALVIAVNDEDAFIMSLTENIARRKYSALELLISIEQLSEQGYDKRVIAQKTGLSLDYIRGILLLFEKGEERLLAAVESGRVPLSVAITIAGASDEEAVQAALQDAYENGQLRGGQLMQTRRVLQRRNTLGKTLKHRPGRKGAAVTTTSLVRNYQNEVERQKLTIKKAEFTQQRLLFVIEALRQLLADEHFSNLLRAEGLDTLPKQLAERVWGGGHTA